MGDRVTKEVVETKEIVTWGGEWRRQVEGLPQMMIELSVTPSRAGHILKHLTS